MERICATSAGSGAKSAGGWWPQAARVERKSTHRIERFIEDPHESRVQRVLYQDCYALLRETRLRAIVKPQGAGLVPRNACVALALGTAASRELAVHNANANAPLAAPTPPSAVPAPQFVPFCTGLPPSPFAHLGSCLNPLHAPLPDSLPCSASAPRSPPRWMRTKCAIGSSKGCATMRSDTISSACSCSTTTRTSACCARAWDGRT